MSTIKNNSPKRILILSEAAKLFREKGYGGTSMRDLAEKVGIEAASMYNHIRSKDEILEAICFDLAKTHEAQMAETEQLPISITEKIESLIAFHVQLIIDNPNAVSVLNNDWKYLHEDKMKTFKEIRKRYEKHFAALIQQGVAEGIFRNVNVSVALFTILSALRWLELWYKPNRDIKKEDLAKEISSILMNGVKA